MLETRLMYLIRLIEEILNALSQASDDSKGVAKHIKA